MNTNLTILNFGKYNKNPILNKEEANAYKWVDMNWLKKDIEIHSEIYTAWLKVCFEKVLMEKME